MINSVIINTYYDKNIDQKEFSQFVGGRVNFKITLENNWSYLGGSGRQT